MEQEELFGEGLALFVVKDRSDVGGRLRMSRIVGPVAAYDEDARCSARYLQGRRAVAMGVIPEGSRRMIVRHIDLEGEFGLRGDVEEHIVAIAGRRDVQAVGMQVDGVQAAWGRCPRSVERPIGGSG